MIKQLYEEIKKGINVRANLSTLRNEVKDFVKMDHLYELVCDEMDVFNMLLSNPDAKTRKNAALLMGDLDMSDFLAPLMEAYEKEETLFVKSAYLEAVKNYDYEKYLPMLRARLKTLTDADITQENKKHVEEEIKLLHQLLNAKTGAIKHTFRGFQTPQDIILLTNKLHKDNVEAAIKELPVEARFAEFPGGVRLKTKDVKMLFHVRSFHSMLFVVPKCSSVPMDPIEAAEAVSKSLLLLMIRESHKEPGPYAFRLELKSSLKLDQKTAFAKKFSNELQMLSKHELINDPSGYEFEIRLIENKAGNYNVLLKMNTIKDTRFSYQAMPYATSLKPSNAALLVSLAKEYMVPDAQVLDPYVSGAELLIERQMAVKANTSYGLDTREEALESANKHAFLADQIIHFVKKDFGSFSHEYPFDEIFTQMPFALGYKSLNEVEEEYRRFFMHVRYVLKKTGTMILYTHDLSFVKKYMESANAFMEREIPVGYKEKTYLCILKLKD